MTLQRSSLRAKRSNLVGDDIMALFEGETVPEFQPIGSIALHKLDILDAVPGLLIFGRRPMIASRHSRATVAVSHPTASGPFGAV
jgi:hypothetical protein